MIRASERVEEPLPNHVNSEVSQGAGKRPTGKLNIVVILLNLIIISGGLFTIVGLSYTGLFYLWQEVKGSHLQAVYLAEMARDATVEIVNRSSSRIRFPKEGPYDVRLGYTQIEEITKKLLNGGYRVAKQAQVSKGHAELIDHGIFPLYDEKYQTGLEILSRDGGMLYRARYPLRVYRDFFDIPGSVIDALLFIEDRHVLTQDSVYHNPAIEWDRFAKAFVDVLVSKFNPAHDVHGGSTLATQTEKFRHSRDGRTQGIKDKLLQMTSAALRAYRDGPINIGKRRNIVLNYINTVPLAAIRGFGEVNGLGDGIWAYFGYDFDRMNTLLTRDFPSLSEKDKQEYAKYYLGVLSLFLAHRRPSDYLGANTESLKAQLEKYVPALVHEGIITQDLADHVNQIEVSYRRVLPKEPVLPFIESKTNYTLRAQLLRLLRVPSLYDLDRFDLQARTTLDVPVQEKVMAMLQGLHNPEIVKKAGLYGHYMFTPSNDLAKMIASVTIYEKTSVGNFLRVQADNYNQPLNISEGVKLDLGSTSKLRTLITYLQVIERIFNQYKEHDSKRIGELLKKESFDPLTEWTLRYLNNPKAQRSLSVVLQAAMERKYSASPGEAFFTAGGLHTFHNFNKIYNGSIVTMSTALRHSINLPFIRLMRDLVRYYAQFVGTNGVSLKTISRMDSTQRIMYLKRFADTEGGKFLSGFFRRYQAKVGDEIIDEFLKGTKRYESRLAVLAWQIRPPKSFAEFLETYRMVVGSRLEYAEEKAYVQFERLVPYSDILADRAYIAGVHPLELWIAAFLYNNPHSSLKEALKQSQIARQDSYRWLFKTRHRGAQDKRIRIIVESEAFQFIHADWKKVGYPHSSLVPSYASALGVSADTPDALAKLVGIILNDGLVKPYYRMSELHFATSTPYETGFDISPSPGNYPRVLSPEVCQVIKAAMLDVTQNGTAVRIRQGLSDGERSYLLGGKTGTGDHREMIARRGKGVVAIVKNRSANFMFYIGDYFFGTVTLFVPGGDAADFSFTSSLAVQILKYLEPALAPMLRRGSLESADSNYSLRRVS
jgi:membrane peptidoglycan carboxypeptidase